MRETVAKCIVAVGAGFALMVAQGCKKQAAPAPVQAVVSSSAPKVQPDFPVGPLPVEDVDSGAKPRVDRVARRQQQVQPVPVQSADAQAAAVAAVAAAQRRQDERLLQQRQDERLLQQRQDERLLRQQEAASQRQQEELDQDIEQNMKMQEEMEAEPRIQDTPGAPLMTPPQPTQPQ